MFKKQTKVFRAGTVVNVSIVAPGNRTINNINNLTTPAGSVTADYGNTVNVLIDAYSDWGVIRIFPTGSVVVERRGDDSELIAPLPSGEAKK